MMTHFVPLLLPCVRARLRGTMLLLGSLAATACDGSVEATAADAGLDARSSSSDAAPSPEQARPEAGVPAEAGTDARDRASQADAYCAAKASRSACGKDVEPCSETGKCLARALSPAAAAAYNQCFGAPACRYDDDCANQAGYAAGGAAAMAYLGACTTKRESCSVKGDFCAPSAYAYPGLEHRTG